MVCYFFDFCIGLDCCVFSFKFGRKFRVILDIDLCILMVFVGIDKWKFLEILLDIIIKLEIGMKKNLFYGNFKID